MRISLVLLLLAALPTQAQTNWFSEARLKPPELRKAFESLNEAAIVDEWIRLTEIPAPSGKEQARADYVRTELQKLGLTDIRVDEMLNVSGVRKGTGGGPAVAFAAHLDTVFPANTNVKVKRDGDTLRAPGIGDDTGNVVAMLEAFRALNRAGIKTKGDLIFVATTQEEVGLKGAKYWLNRSGYQPDMFVALDVPSNQVWYGALRIDLLKFFYTSSSVHTLYSRDTASPAKAVAKAITAVYNIPLPPLADGVGTVRLPVVNVGTLGGGTVANAIPSETWFTVDLRSLDTATQDRLRAAVIDTRAGRIPYGTNGGDRGLFQVVFARAAAKSFLGANRSRNGKSLSCNGDTVNCPNGSRFDRREHCGQSRHTCYRHRSRAVD
jgi:acetylornithine deacetylase/succinyl-diaminopimelate desuccinylase-like protein